MAVFRRMRFAMGQNQIGLRMVANYLNAGHMQPHLAKMRALYREKMQRTASALAKHAGDLLQFTKPDGGFYLWSALPEGVSAQKVWRYAYEEGVLLNPGSGFHPERREPGREHMRVAYAWVPLDDIDEAARRLAIACARGADEARA
jgi:2-aminoadipate transaminase